MTSLDASLLEERWQGSLADIARQHRLVLNLDHGSRKVDLCWVDEVALALIERAKAHKSGLTIVYPAAAGQVAVLLAAQLLLHQFLRGNNQASVGIVTADTTMATRTWNALAISAPGATRVPIASVFPCYRAGPEGESPIGGRHLPGVIIGQRCQGWPVDDLVVDHLAGLVRLDSSQATIEVFADPTEQGLTAAESHGRLIWGWSEAALAEARHQETRALPSAAFSVPFSVAGDRLRVMADGIDVRLSIARHPEAEKALNRVREDLRLLRASASNRRDRHLERGLRAAWHHLSTLVSMPYTPSRFDRFTGLPPRAVRSTQSYVPELSSWANTLTGDQAELATFLAMDIADLRAELDRGNPFEQMLKDIYAQGKPTLLVTRSGTATKALQEVLGSDLKSGAVTAVPIGSLHRLGTFPRVVMIGEPRPWDWHRLLSGIAPTVEVLTLGEKSAAGCASTIQSVRSAMDHWGGSPVRERTWHALVRRPLPALPPPAIIERRPVAVIDGAEYVPEPDPFEALSSLFDLGPIDFEGGASEMAIARQTDDGEWAGAVPTVTVETDHGTVLLGVGQPVDVRDGIKLAEVRPELLEPGAVLLIGRREGRVGLLDALEHRLGHRPDLLTARFLIDRYRKKVRKRFSDSGLTAAELYRTLADLGCDKGLAAVRSWVTDVTMAPREFADLERLNQALELGMKPDELREFFTAVQHRRGFRRAAGRALHASATESTVVSDDTQVDSETGLSIADLREAVIEATVTKVTLCAEPVPVTLIGRLENP